MILKLYILYRYVFLDFIMQFYKNLKLKSKCLKFKSKKLIPEDYLYLLFYQNTFWYWFFCFKKS